MSKRWFGAGLLAGLMVHLMPVGASAHPHAWIDVVSRIEIDADGRLVSIRMAWTFDDYYSLFLMQDLMPAPGEPKDEALWAAKAEEFQDNLAERDFFTELLVNGKAVGLHPVADPRLDEQDALMSLTMTLAPAEPVPLAGSRGAEPARPAEFRIYDPTYYIEILHAADDGVSLAGPGARRCTATVVEPNPPTEAVLMAAALDVGDQGDAGLGRLFAERVDLACAGR